MSHSFSEQDRYDLKEIFRIYDFSKVEKVNDIVADAEKAGTSPAELFDNLYELYKIKKLPQREAVAKRLHMTVTTASDAEVESVLRQTEMKGFSERDAVRSLERKHKMQHVTSQTLQDARSHLNNTQSNAEGAGEQSELLRVTSQLRHVSLNDNSTSSLIGGKASTSKAEDNQPKDASDEPSVIISRPPSHLSAAPTRENMDETIAEEVREWLAKMLGEAYNSDVLSTQNFIDALRNGALLSVLLQKMQDPPVADADLKLPKRATGFFIRDNVATFLKEAKTRFDLVDAQLFTVSDLVDGKNDRQVVTCLMAIARTAYAAGTITTAPNIIMYEHEIEHNGSKLTKADLDRIVREAEAAEEQFIPTLQHQDAEGEKTEEKKSVFEQEEQASESASKEESSEPPTAVFSAPKMPPRDGAAQVEEVGPTPGKEYAASSLIQENTTNEDSGSAPEADENPSVTPVRPETLLDVSHQTKADGTRKPTKLDSPSDFHGTRELQEGPEAAESAADISPQPKKVAEEAKETPAESVERNRDPCSECLHTPQERVTRSAEEVDTPSAPHSDKKDEKQPHKDEESGDAEDGGCVFYLRDGKLRTTRPTPVEELQLEKHRKKVPRVVWKSPMTPLSATKPPRYHSRHWDGIDTALGRHLNEHYEVYQNSPWRFNMVASTSGEYVLYNRQNAQKRVVYLRIIQARLFLRNAGKNQPWVDIDQALIALENEK